MSQVFNVQRALDSLANGKYAESLKNFFVSLIGLEKTRRLQYEPHFRSAMEYWFAEDHMNAMKMYEMLDKIELLFGEDSIKIKISILRAVIDFEIPDILPRLLFFCENIYNAPGVSNYPEDMSELRIIRMNLKSQAFSQWHMKMINDLDRNRKFQEAIMRNPEKSIVFDIGTGTGLLAVIAANIPGVKKVIAIEENNQLIKIAQETIVNNNCKNIVKIEWTNSLSPYFEVKKENDRPDLIVSEILDCCIFGENIISTFLDAHRRFTKKSTIFSPSNASLYGRLIYSPKINKLHCQGNFRSTYIKTFDIFQQEDPYWCCKKEDFEDLSEPKNIIDVDFQNFEKLVEFERRKDETFEIIPNKNGVCHGVAVHFLANLLPNNDISCQINSSSPNSCWDMGIFPFAEPIEVTCGVPLTLNYSINKDRLDIWCSRGFSEDKTYEIKSVEEIYNLSNREKTINNETTLDLSTSFDLKNESNLSKYTTVFTNLRRQDGSFDSEAFLRLEGAIISLKNIENITPKSVKIIGRLFKSEKIHQESRPDSNMHCHVDLLKSLKGFNLMEYRDIDLKSTNFDVEFCSDEFEIFEFDFGDVMRLAKKEYSNLSRRFQIKTISSCGPIDGVIYEFEIDGSRNNGNRAAFLFEERRSNLSKADLVFDFQEAQMLISDIVL